jgi:hypothetical protein
MVMKMNTTAMMAMDTTASVPGCASIGEEWGIDAGKIQALAACKLKDILSKNQSHPRTKPESSPRKV